MNNITSIDINSLPNSLQGYESIKMLGQIIAGYLNNISEEIDKTIIFPRIDELSEELLDVLAYDLHIDWYDYSYSIEQKRNVIKTSINVHRKLGTKYAVETALRAAYPDSKVVPWFENGGAPYSFEVILNISDSGESVRFDEVGNIVNYYKSLRDNVSKTEFITKRFQNMYCGIAIVPSKIEVLNLEYENISTGIIEDVNIGTHLTGIRREVMDCEVITPVSAGGDIVGSILVYGITDNGIAGYIKPQIQETYVTICRGGSQRFTVQEVISDSVIWSVAGNTDSATAIDENGFLNVGENEESTSLTVTATTVDGVASCSVSAAVDLSVTVLRLFDSGELDICPMSGMVITQKQSNGTDYEITDRIYRIRTAVTNASTDIKVPFTRNLTGYSKLCFNGGFLTTYGSQYDILSVGLYDSSDSATTLTIHSGYGSFELEIDQTKEYSALMIGSCYGEIEITKIWLEP